MPTIAPRHNKIDKECSQRNGNVDQKQFFKEAEKCIKFSGNVQICANLREMEAMFARASISRESLLQVQDL